MRSLSLVEIAAVVAVGGSVVAVVIPSFLENLHASRLTEPLDGLNRIAARATALAAGRPAEAAYPGSVGLTPAQVPRGELVTDPPGTWSNPTWKRLGMEFDAPHAYSFAFESHNAPSASAPADSGNSATAGSVVAVAPAAASAASSASAAPAADASGDPLATPGKATFYAVAHGDLDGDGSLSTFEISGECREGSEPTVQPITMSREVE